jgi:hypothetical protein
MKPHVPTEMLREVSMPRLSDEAAAEIHLFLGDVLQLFEQRYADQITRHWQDLSQDNVFTGPQSEWAEWEGEDEPF